ncbi:sigma-54 interaction domain-containing protein [Anaerosphaera multitolerans]|uniref:AAA family ATPase n=1 Tax=Anaerosphaera multitolerans TaxID=2487351 RepID=A0A437S7K8_9FIRM|nr:sigma 54-interacting transcriptional regulator [Anaerosphaera multitolerans]RVU55043.1 AAA family ATPase [Anaerosphaera multitolerans]
MKRITILSIDEDSAQFYKEQVTSIFKENIIVDYRNLEMVPILPVVNTDLILYTDPEIINLLIDKIQCNVSQLMMKRTIPKAILREINKIEPDSRVLVVNINEFMANETMALIYQLGKTDIFMEPYFPGKNLAEKDFDYIIHVAPEKYDFLGDIKAKDIVTGHRILDVSNVLDIVYILNIDESIAREIILNMMSVVPTCWYGVNYSMERKMISEAQLDYILNDLDSGVLILDKDNDINTLNKTFSKFIGVSEKDIAYKNFFEVFKDEENLIKLFEKGEVKEELTTVNGIECFVTIGDIEYSDVSYGKMILIKEYFEVVEMFNKSNKIVKSGYFSKYTFDNIIGNSSSMRRIVNEAKKFSKTDHPVLILGETGTGKELFAGAIHNDSPRKKGPFIAINCSTLSKTLLESELFGYEEGAFTGAKKGGKIGLFERASGGTLFLDEIGDLPMELQPRLLRALEEQSIMRVGGDKVVNINTRIIAATNRNIMEMVERGEFRRDLLYRLNVFELDIAPLRERPEDITCILSNLMSEKGISRKFSRGFEIFTRNYNWLGNARELKNLVSYLEVMTEKEIYFYSIPAYLKKREYFNEDCLKYLVLNLIHCLNQLKLSSGRRTLERVFSEVYFKISEVEIRNMVNELESLNFIEVSTGRAGNNITEMGVEFLVNERYLLNEEESEVAIKIKEEMDEKL